MPKIIAYGIAVFFCYVVIQSLLPYFLWALGMLIGYFLWLQFKENK